jgi:tetratricopeptide (TPR) repeat protein
MASAGPPRPAPFTELAGDEAILNFIFNRGGPGAIQQSMDCRPLPATIIPAIEQAARESELRAVRLAESGQLMEALSILDSMCSSNPTRASTFNNRAQVFKLLGRLDEQETDLAVAISLAQSCLETADDADLTAKETQCRVLAQAYTQRAVLYL